MTKYYFAELQNPSSYRQAKPMKAKSLAGAKRAAERRQFFVGTVLEIGDRVDGNGFISHRLAYKEDGHWFDVDDEWEGEPDGQDPDPDIHY